MRKPLKRFSVIILLATASTGALGQTYGTSTTATVGTTSTMPGVMNNTATTTWNEQNDYWRSHYSSRPYYNASRNYSEYEPAYQYGVQLYSQHPGTPYQNLNQAQISNNWSNVRGNSNLDWNDAQMATQDAYNHMYQTGNTSAGTMTHSTYGTTR